MAKYDSASGHSTQYLRKEKKNARHSSDSVSMGDAIIRLIYCYFVWKSPVYDPTKWNDSDGIQYSNNCYNYACNKQTGTYAQPGRASGHIYASVDCAVVSNAAISDGLRSVAEQSCGNCSHLVAMVIWPDPVYPDFHWYRRDADGMWSHKPGGTEASNVDNAGNPISDPRTCDRGPYTIFCGFFPRDAQRVC